MNLTFLTLHITHGSSKTELKISWHIAHMTLWERSTQSISLIEVITNLTRHGLVKTLENICKLFTHFSMLLVKDQEIFMQFIAYVIRKGLTSLN